MPAPAHARRALTAVLSTLVLLLGGLVAAGPSAAAPSPAPDGDGLVQTFATIEDEEAFCRWLTGIYVNHPTYYTVRVYNCRHTAVFMKGVHLNGTYGTCVLVPARSSRHLGGSIIKPMENAQVC